MGTGIHGTKNKLLEDIQPRRIQPIARDTASEDIFKSFLLFTQTTQYLHIFNTIVCYYKDVQKNTTKYHLPPQTGGELLK